jgi:protein-tyrosine-phosphatase
LRQLVADAGRTDIEVDSAGTMALAGEPASEGTYLVALENGMDLSSHRAQVLSPELARQGDLVLTMSRSHRQRASDLGAANVAVLGEFAGASGPDAEVPDPFGGELEDYRAAFTQLDRFLRAALARLLRERPR